MMDDEIESLREC